MAVLDFRGGGKDGAYRPGSGRAEYPYEHRRREVAEDDPQDWDDGAYSFDAEGDLAASRQGLAARLSRLANYLGAVISVMLLLGLAVWGYRLIVRDVSGIPIVRAIEGDARISPEEPGGQLSRHTGLSVNSVAAGGDPALPTEVAIAPAATGLTDEDVAMGEFGATAREPTSDLSDLGAAPAPVEIAVPDGEPPTTDAVTEADGVTPVETAITAALAEANQIRPQVEIPQGSRAVAQSDRPLVRPSGAAAAMASASDPAPDAAAAPQVPQVAPAAIAAGTPLVQIGAFDTEADARREWARVSGRFGSNFAGKSQVLQTAESGGRSFVRLRVAGFGSKDEARRFCAALVAENFACIPATAR